MTLLSDDQAADLIERLAADIPVDDPPLATLLHDGQRARRRRSLVALAVVGSTAALLVPLALALVNGARDDRSSEPAGTTGAADSAAVRRALDDYDPVRTRDLLLERSHAAFAEGYPDLAAGVATFEDESGNTLPQDYLDKASYLSAEYFLGDSAALKVWIGHQVDPSGDPLEQQCGKRGDIYAACEVVDVPSGGRALSTVMPVEWGRFRMGLLPDQVANANQEQLWFDHEVAFWHSDDHMTTAGELVRATSLDEARSLFRLSNEALASVAADPELVIPRAPQAGDCGPWTLKNGPTCNPTDADTQLAQDALDREINTLSAPAINASYYVTSGTMLEAGCGSGRLLHLIADAHDSYLEVTADASTGATCKVKVRTGHAGSSLPQVTSLQLH